MTLPGHNRVTAPRPAHSRPAHSRPSSKHTQQSPSPLPPPPSPPPALPALRHPPFSKNLRWTTVTLVRYLTSRAPPLRPCAHAADHVARAALRDIAHRFPHNKDLAAVERNARRRLYDAIKVMTAVGTIHKFAKNLKWLGVHHLVSDVPAMRRLIRAKKTVLLRKSRTLLAMRQSVSQFRRFLAHKKSSSRSPCPNNCQRFYFPFVLLSARAPDVSCSPDRKSLNVHMRHPFSLFSEADVVSMLHSNAYPYHPACHPLGAAHRLASVAPRPPPAPPLPAQPSKTPLIMMRHRQHVQVETHPKTPASTPHSKRPTSTADPPHSHLPRRAPDLPIQLEHATHPTPLPSVKLTLRIRHPNIKTAAKPQSADIASPHACHSQPSPPRKPLSQMAEKHGANPRARVDRHSIWAAIVEEVAGKHSRFSSSPSGTHYKSPPQKAIRKSHQTLRPGAQIGCRTGRKRSTSPSASDMEVMEEQLVHYVNEGHVDEPEPDNQSQPEQHSTTKQELDLLCYEQLDLESLPDVADQQRARVMAYPPPLFIPSPHVEPVSHTAVEQRQAECPDIVPYHTRPDDDDDLMDLDIDMDMDSDLCLSDGVS